MWGIWNKDLETFLPEAFRYGSQLEAIIGREELVMAGKDLDTQRDINRRLEVVPLSSESRKKAALSCRDKAKKPPHFEGNKDSEWWTYVTPYGMNYLCPCCGKVNRGLNKSNRLYNHFASCKRLDQEKGQK